MTAEEQLRVLIGDLVVQIALLKTENQQLQTRIAQLELAPRAPIPPSQSPD